MKQELLQRPCRSLPAGVLRVLQKSLVSLGNAHAIHDLKLMTKHMFNAERRQLDARSQLTATT